MVTEGVKPMINSVIMSQSLHCYISQSDKGGVVFGGDPDNWPSYAQRGNPMVMEGCGRTRPCARPGLITPAYGADLERCYRYEL